MFSSSSLFPFVDEAIKSLGYIKPNYTSELAEMLGADFGVVHPYQVARLFRQKGEQISNEEKRSLGLRSNTALSRAALNSLTEKGLRLPKQAIEITLLRAAFSGFRARAIEATPREPDWYVRATGLHPCRKCEELNGKNFLPTEISPLPPPGCEREACSLHLAARCDFIGRAVRESRI